MAGPSIDSNNTSRSTAGSTAGSKVPGKASKKTTSNAIGAHIAVQSGLGAVFFAIWAFVNLAMSTESLITILTNCAPYYAMFVIGILSRYMPGVKNLAKRLKHALPS